MTTATQYTAEEADRILRAAPLLTEVQVMKRWKCSKRWLRALVNGNHPQGVKLDAIRLSTQVWRFRPIECRAGAVGLNVVTRLVTLS